MVGANLFAQQVPIFAHIVRCVAPTCYTASCGELNPKRLNEQTKNELYRKNKCSIANRIVSMHMPEVHPMVRVKAGKNVEFGVKPGIGITEDGFNLKPSL